jgi:hypothetical protein
LALIHPPPLIAFSDPSDAMRSSTPVASAADADEDLGKMQVDNSDDLAPNQDTGKSSDDGGEAGSP